MDQVPANGASSVSNDIIIADIREINDNQGLEHCVSSQLSSKVASRCAHTMSAYYVGQVSRTMPTYLGRYLPT